LNTDRSIPVSEILGQIWTSLGFILPELILAVGFIFILLLGIIFKGRSSIGYIGSLVVYSLALFADYEQWVFFEDFKPVDLFFNLITLDRFGVYFKFLFDISGLLTLWLTYFYRDKLDPEKFIEYAVIIMAIVLGAHFMAMSLNLLSVYISIELVSISSYILTGFLFNKKGAESGIKYLLFGAFSSGVMLYGMSLLYGFSGTLNFTSDVFFHNLEAIPLPALIVAFTLTLCGLLFKASIVPFHLWAPDIYEGSPTPVVAFFAVVPKAAGFAILFRFISSGQLITNDILFNALAVLAIITMFLGNLGAIGQKNIKRMLAYSSISQAGFIVVGILARTEWGIESMLFYITIYLIMNFGVFLLVQILEHISGSEKMEDFKGLGLHYSFIGVSMLVVMISLAGLPPTAGFLSKLYIFSALWDTYQLSANPILLWVFVLGLLNLVISLFYYLKVPFLMFFKEREGTHYIKLGVKEYISLTLFIVPLFILFFKSEILLHFINSISINFN
jgi:NADH-quinone oxidoreductase subunit N